MTNEEMITDLLRENLEFKKLLGEINESTRDIHGILYAVGAGLNDNVKQFTKEQMKDLFAIAEIIEYIRESIPLKVK